MYNPAALSLNSYSATFVSHPPSLYRGGQLSDDLSANDLSRPLDPSTFARLPFELVKIIYELALWGSLALRNAGPVCTALEPVFERVRRGWLDQCGPRHTDFCSECSYAETLHVTGQVVEHEMARHRSFSELALHSNDIHPFIAMAICCAGFNEPSVGVEALDARSDLGWHLGTYPFAEPALEAPSTGPSSESPFVPFSTLWTPPSCPLLASITRLGLQVGNQASFEVVGEPEAQVFGAFMQLMRMVPDLRSLRLDHVVHPSVTIALLQALPQPQKLRDLRIHHVLVNEDGRATYPLPHLVRQTANSLICCIGDILRLVPKLRQLQVDSQNTDWISDGTVRALQGRQPLDHLEIGVVEYSNQYFPGEEATRFLKLVEALGPDRMPRRIKFNVLDEKDNCKVGARAVDLPTVAAGKPFLQSLDDWIAPRWLRRGYGKCGECWWRDVVTVEELLTFKRIKDVVEKAGASFECYLADEQSMMAATTFLQTLWQERRDVAYQAGRSGCVGTVKTEECEGMDACQQSG
ncbi:hypothetical protein Rt10032_c01g0529 [Rhodotorula toruloides]|uniref:Uncharacterized protein n=1 Tax=Rhodotorula toruloides TaxID=5286 RepID=A0A511K850_RHOTO|nr:hypothetical protein Rt10032_c01g0529 [Rhodotorula toruloides]